MTTLLLGISVGSANLTAAPAASAAPGSATTNSTATTPAVLTVHADGTAELGAHPAPGSEVVRDFAGRFGDPVPMVTSSGRSYTGTELTAAAVTSLAARCTPDSNPTVFVSHPAELTAHAIVDAEEQLRTCGLSDVHFVPDAVAAAAWAQSAGQVFPGDVAVVYDLGATGLTVTLVHVNDRPGTAGILGSPVRSEEFSGDHIDAALLRQVLSGVTAAHPQFAAASTTPEELRALRSACRVAKESLATETATSIPVRLDSFATEIRLVRAELEDLISPALQSSIDLMHDAIRRAGLDDHDVTRVIATGGGAAIPLVSEALSRETRLPVAVADQPGATAALGALATGLTATRSAPVTDPFLIEADPWATDPTVAATTAIEDRRVETVADDDVPLAPAPRAAASTAKDSRTRRWVYRGGAAAAAVAALAVGVALHSGKAAAPIATARPAIQTGTASTTTHSATNTSPTATSARANSQRQQAAGTATPPGNSAPGTRTPGTANAAATQPAGPAASGPTNSSPANAAPQAPAPASTPSAPANTPDPGQTVPPESAPQITLPTPHLPLSNVLGNAGQNLLNP
ncbi:Hsp70 family protein [Jongsikchunia kroppenstedtii]|uniref:Hsp70 family protein n=1 Tax=Jongsikchunia kroppenstedtii TaxID=1121721 RepID=UPI000377E24F|nr:Hsp70 family protein [Jongsikchunia kroppenstedtii]